MKTALCFALFAAAASAQVSRQTVLDPAAPGLMEKSDLASATTSIVQTPTGPALEVTFGHDSAWPHLMFRAGDAYDLTDWSTSNVLAFTITNPMDVAVQVNVRVDDSAEADGAKHCRQGGVSVPPGGPVEVRFDLSTFQLEGMRGQPRNRGVDRSVGLWIDPSWRELDLGHIVAFQLFMARPQADFTLRLHKVELLRAQSAELKPFVDRYGQFTDEEWPGKVHTDADLAQVRTEEEADLAAHPAPADRDRFGGWAAGPQLESTGRFRAAKHEGKWWFVDPDGRLFWSSGITCVRPESSGPVMGREKYFTWLPEEGDPLRPFYSSKGNGWLDFGKMNLFRKFGESYSAVSHELAAQRLLSWGFNTIGNWSDGEVCQLDKVPYTIPVGFRSPRVEITDTRSFPDVFSPEFEPAVRKGVADKAAYKDDPWLLGVFIENELPWAGWGKNANVLPATILVSETASEMRTVMLRELRAKYDTIAKLNEAWGTAFASWEALPGSPKLTNEQQEKAGADLSAFCTLLAERYFTVCEQAMRDLMPGVLYFGPRLASYNRETVAVAAKHCDVVCFNIYNDLPTDRDADELAKELDFPIVIGEFHFGALDRGMFHTGLRKAANQAERAEKFASYVRTAASSDWCVGSHWFQYRDQPLTGRFDGENYNIGFVTITDTPYPEMRAAARALHSELYRLHAAPVAP